MGDNLTVANNIPDATFRLIPGDSGSKFFGNADGISKMLVGVVLDMIHNKISVANALFLFHQRFNVVVLFDSIGFFHRNPLKKTKITKIYSSGDFKFKYIWVGCYVILAVGYGQYLSADGSSSRQHFSAVDCFHPGSEAVNSSAFDFARLVCFTHDNASKSGPKTMLHHYTGFSDCCQQIFILNHIRVFIHFSTMRRLATITTFPDFPQTC